MTHTKEVIIMIGAVIYYGKNTLVAELPMGSMDLQMKLSSIGVTQYLYENNHKGIISEEIFNAVQAEKQRRARKNG